MFDDPVDSPMDLRRAVVRRASDGVPEATSAPDRPATGYESAEMRDLHARLMGFVRAELDRQAENRALQARDEDFYDHVQWDHEDMDALKERGQVPLTFNVVASTVDWVLGTEKRGRSDFKILPRRKDQSRQAERKSQLLKYLSDVNRTPFSLSRAFEDAVKVGVGWIECGVQNDDDGEPVYERAESWRNMLWDSVASEPDLEDARYVIRQRWVDLDVAKALVPGRGGILDRAAVDGPFAGAGLVDGDEAMDSREDHLRGSGSFTSADSARQRVRLIEVWFRKPTPARRLSGGDFRGEIFDPAAPGHRAALEAGESILVERVMMRMHVALMTASDLLVLEESPYRHNKFPFTPVWWRRRGRNGLPYGMVRGLTDIQQDINKRAAKALAILSANKVIMDEGAVDDLDELAEEVARPDAIIVKKPGKDLVISADREIAAAHMEMMSRNISLIQSSSGVTDELMGRSTNAKSGIAIQARQSQGSMVTAGGFDSLRFAKQCHGEKLLSLVEQYFTEAKSFRITNMRGAPDYVTVNDGLPENDIHATKADYVISEMDWRASVRQAQTEELFSLLQQLAPAAPQLALVMLDLLVEGMDVPSREELVARIRQVTGMRDPDAEQPTQEEIVKAQAAQQQAMMQQAMVEAQIAERQASAQHKAAMAQKAQADTKATLGALAGTNVGTLKAALEAALMMLSTAPAVPVADQVLGEAGFVSAVDEARMQAAAAQAQQQAQAQAAMEQQQMQAAQAAQQQATQQQATQQVPPALPPDHQPQVADMAPAQA